MFLDPGGIADTRPFFYVSEIVAFRYAPVRQLSHLAMLILVTTTIQYFGAQWTAYTLVPPLLRTHCCQYRTGLYYSPVG